jgi:hypothetical protein
LTRKRILSLVLFDLAAILAVAGLIALAVWQMGLAPGAYCKKFGLKSAARGEFALGSPLQKFGVIAA